jgi:hypothetical protein
MKQHLFDDWYADHINFNLVYDGVRLTHNWAYRDVFGALV